MKAACLAIYFYYVWVWKRKVELIRKFLKANVMELRNKFHFEEIKGGLNRDMTTKIRTLFLGSVSRAVLGKPFPQLVGYNQLYPYTPLGVY